MTFNDLGDIEKCVIGWYRPNSAVKVVEFFNDLRKHFALYSPSLGLVVEYNDWYCGNKSEGQTIDFVPITPRELADYWNATNFDVNEDPGEHWAGGLLADFDHISYYFDDSDSDADSALSAIAMVCLASDWTSEPYKIV